MIKEKLRARWIRRMSALHIQWQKTRKGRIKLKMYKEQAGLCSLCGETMLDFSRGYPSFDHQIPKCRGGSGKQSNLKLAHSECNRLRSNTPLEIELSERV